MKRYTKEFLHDEIRAAKRMSEETQNIVFEKRIEKLSKIEYLAEKGLITDFEAIKFACKEIEPE